MRMNEIRKLAKKEINEWIMNWLLELGWLPRKDKRTNWNLLKFDEAEIDWANEWNGNKLNEIKKYYELKLRFVWLINLRFHSMPAINQTEDIQFIETGLNWNQPQLIESNRNWNKESKLTMNSRQLMNSQFRSIKTEAEWNSIIMPDMNNGGC